jgi:hypothetical protein
MFIGNKRGYYLYEKQTEQKLCLLVIKEDRAKVMFIRNKGGQNKSYVNLIESHPSFSSSSAPSISANMVTA